MGKNYWLLGAQHLRQALEISAEKAQQKKD